MGVPWYKRLWKLWSLFGRLLADAAIVSLPILVFAVVSILFWMFLVEPAIEGVIRARVVETKQQDYLVYAVGQLADWSWRVILLGAFAALIYERIKRREELDSRRDAILGQVRHVRTTENWNLLDELYPELTQLGSESQNQELRREMASAFYERTTRSAATDWKLAYPNETDKGWLGLAKNLDPKNEKVKMLLEFAENVRSSDKSKYNNALTCIQELPSKLWVSFMRFHRESIHFGVVNNSQLKLELEKTIRANVPEHEDYFLYALLNLLPPLDPETLKFFTARKIDKENYRDGALAGRAELELAKIPHFDASQITCVPKKGEPPSLSCVTDFVERALQPRHLLIVGNQGDGKTFLNRQLEYWTRKFDPTWIHVNWRSLIPLLEENQISVPVTLKSFVQDLGSTLQQQERFREIVQVMNWKGMSDWRVPLQEMKELLRAKGIQGLYVAIDNLDKYPEFRGDAQFLMVLASRLLRPEIVEESPPCYLRLFIEPITHQQLDLGKTPWSLFETLHLKWGKEQKREILKLRVQAIEDIGTPIISEQEQLLIINNTGSVREAIAQLNRYYAREKQAYLRVMEEWESQAAM